MIPQPRAGRISSILAGIIFLGAAIAKVADLPAFVEQISAYRIFSSTDVLVALSIVLITVESALGLGILFFTSQLRSLVRWSGLLLLGGMTAIVVYADIRWGMDSCGCFGRWWTLSPNETYLKNVILAILLIGATQPVVVPRISARIKVVVGIATVVGIGWLSFNVSEVMGNLRNERTWEKAIDNKEAFVAFLTPCESCLPFIQALSLLAEDPNMPSIKIMFLGDEQEFEPFKSGLNQEIDVFYVSVPFFFDHLVGRPVALQYRRKGKVVMEWNNKFPSEVELLNVVLGL